MSNSHLKVIIDRNVPVHIIYNGIYFPQCKLICAACPEKGIGLIVSGGVFAAGDRVSVGYILSPYAYTFESEIVGVQTGSREDVLLHIRTPDRIARLERRRWDRTRVSEERPVTIALDVGKDQAKHIKVIDMSLNGVGIALPSPVGGLSLGSQVAMAIGLPKLGTMEATGVVRTVTEGSHAVRYGLEFDPLPDFDGLLAQYLYLRKVEIRAETKSPARLRKERILVMIKDTGQGRYAFACSDSPVKRVDDFGSISEIVEVDVMDFLEDRQEAYYGRILQ